MEPAILQVAQARLGFGRSSIALAFDYLANHRVVASLMDLQSSALALSGLGVIRRCS
jgi:hypothetical protein